MTSTSKRTAVYARLSEVRKSEIPAGLDRAAALSQGMARQLRELHAHAERLDLEIVEELVDEDLTAAKKRNRPAFERLMAGIAANAWDVVILRSLDRWVRRPDELERIIEVVEKSKVKVEAIHGEIDLRTRHGRLQARVVTAVAMAEVEATIERVTDWHADRTARGLPHARPGYGYRRDPGAHDQTIDPDEAARIREAADRLLHGEPLAAIARDYTARGIPAPGAGRWTPQLVRRILAAPRLAGLRVHKGKIAGPGTWPPILDRDTYDRVARLLANPARNAVPIDGSRAPKLLTGIASCATCSTDDLTVTLNHRVNRARRYFCRSCFMSIVAEPLEQLVEAMLFDAVDRPALARTIRQRIDRVDTAAVAAEIVQLEQDLADLAAELGDGRLTMIEWKAARAGIDRRLTDLRALLATDDTTSTLTPYAGKPGALRAAWHDELADDLPARRRILAAVFETIEISPGTVGPRVFNSDRVNPVWR